MHDCLEETINNNNNNKNVVIKVEIDEYTYICQMISRSSEINLLLLMMIIKRSFIFNVDRLTCITVVY